MQYFSGRFKDKASDLILDFHSSINFDQKLYKYDIMGSIAHVKGLSKSSIITEDEADLIEKELTQIGKEIQEGKLEFKIEFEDIHMNIEKILIDRLGEVGKKVHTGRSRNDQVAVDMKLFIKDEIQEIKQYILDLLVVLIKKSVENKETYLPGFTHLQKAQPISFAHYLLAYCEMFKRDFKRLENTYELLDTCPLGAAALAGTTYNLDRDYVANLLGFKEATMNSLDSVSDRDYLIQLLSDLSIIMMHLSRFCEEIILYSSTDYSYIEVSDSFSTGSSIMPQKKNPDAAELIRGKTGRVYGSLIGLLTVMKGIPLAYNKDMQEDKEGVFDAIDTVKGCLKVFTGMLDEITINKEQMLKACSTGFITATDVADYLSNHGLNFRDAYKIVGEIVQYSINNNKTLEELNLDEYKKFSKLFELDIYEEIKIKNCVDKRKTKGGPSPDSVSEHINHLDIFIKKAINQ